MVDDSAGCRPQSSLGVSQASTLVEHCQERDSTHARRLRNPASREEHWQARTVASADGERRACVPDYRGAPAPWPDREEVFPGPRRGMGRGSRESRETVGWQPDADVVERRERGREAGLPERRGRSGPRDTASSRARAQDAETETGGRERIRTSTASAADLQSVGLSRAQLARVEWRPSVELNHALRYRKPAVSPTASMGRDVRRAIAAAHGATVTARVVR